MKLWSEYSLIDEDGRAIDPAAHREAMREYCRTGEIHEYLFAEPLPGQDPGPESAWEWGPRPEDIDWTGLDVLVAAADIAQRAGVTVDAVHQWSKRHPAFRTLAQDTSAGLIWRWHEVEAWLRETGRL